LAVTVRKVDLLDLAAHGSIPTPLHAAVQQMLAQQGAGGLDLATLPERAAIIDLVVKAALVEPPLADAPSDEAITLDELPFVDRISIFSWAHEEAAQVATFPGDAASGSGVARGRQRVPRPSLGDPPGAVGGLAD
jgi:hypothetical protein